MYRSLCMVLVLFAVSGSTFNGDLIDADYRIAVECKKSSEVSEELYLDLIFFGIDDTMDDPNGQCFVACYHERQQLFNTNGTLNEAVKTKIFDRFINGDQVVDGFRACAVPPSDNCEQKFKSYLCVKDVLVNVAKKRE